MPYRRLPNTDNARLKALKTAYKKGKSTHPQELAFSQATFSRIELFINSFEKAIAHYKAAYETQVERSKEHQQLAKKARLYLSHFIQVLNMAIARGELQPAVREMYGMDIDESKLPSLNSDKDLIEWGKKIIEGEMNRTRRGMQPITNPTIAVVRVRYDQFVEAHNYQKVLQQNTQRMLAQLNDLRKKADEIIVDVWNEVEEHFKDLPDDERREKASSYGVVYVYRKNELKGLSLDSVIPNI
ncbi:hypothetical protein [Tenuifilum thalassicum]|uniref:Uncharacterized protein n=1 Tax=Tenuifilum thalassicum TaxID=2590900 RepID=A0A7D3Y614_9BACT|nr:hypothetical protein [Tenuifilum thalassicum]QKG81069.1 hypothetical protein FHG85_12600 [Tenuifilum thalassicum]